METLISTPTYQSVHNRFKINGYHLDREDLLRVAYSFIKEGDEFEKPVGDFLYDWFDNKDYLEVETSGTTGASKTIRISKQAMVNSAIATGDYFELRPGHKVLNCLPVKFIAGKMMFVRSFILGLDMDFVAPSSRPLHRIDTIYDFGALVPMQAQQSLEKLHQIKKIIIGGAKITKTLEERLLKVPSQIFETYGMTETITHIAARKLGDKHFEVLPGVFLTHDDRQCLVIRAPKIFEEVVITNDIVSLESEKTFSWLGRIDNVINSGGIKFIPEVIEEKLSKKIDRRFIIAGFPDPVLGERVILIVEGESFNIEQTVFKKLDKFEIPRDIYFVSVFPETANGKIKRKEVLEMIK